MTQYPGSSGSNVTKSIKQPEPDSWIQLFWQDAQPAFSAGTRSTHSYTSHLYPTTTGGNFYDSNRRLARFASNVSSSWQRKSMRDELEVLLSIYPEVLVSDDCVETQIPVTFDVPQKVVFESLPSFEVKFLPSLKATLNYDEQYPAEKSPTIQLECEWLPASNLNALVEACQALWQPGDEVLYSILDHLYSQAETAFGLQVQGSIQVVDKLYRALSTYQEQAAAKEFANKSYDCEICLEWKSGMDCLQLCNARHVFCKACLQDMFSLHIREGSVVQVRCPSCPAESEDSADSLVHVSRLPASSTRISFAILQQIISVEEYERYVKLLRKKELEALPSSTYCPRDFCATVLARNPDEKLVVCTNCSLAFCADCKKTWHGPMEPCKRLAINTELGSLYRSLLDDPAKTAERKKMERLYGKKTLERLLAEFEDQKLLEQWRTSNTQACPACGTHIEKSYGCNHLQCGICATHFCFLCGDQLSAQNPYSHYSDKGLYCYGKLFHGLTGLEDPLAGIDLGF